MGILNITPDSFAEAGPRIDPQAAADLARSMQAQGADIIDVWWLLVDRRGFPLDIDEAGYMTIALGDHAGLAHGGITGYWHAVESQAPNAPLVPALNKPLAQE